VLRVSSASSEPGGSAGGGSLMAVRLSASAARLARGRGDGIPPLQPGLQERGDLSAVNHAP